MGEPRSKMVRRTISGLILKEDQEIYYRHRKLLFEFGEPQECELRDCAKRRGNILYPIIGHAEMLLEDIPDSVQINFWHPIYSV
ncbi:MAG: hypothetical protein NDI81_18160 [Desulfobacula sp.]|nr:hypothetical protein [Desulfobacula sp.]